MSTETGQLHLPATIASSPAWLEPLVRSMSVEGYPRTISRALSGAERKATGQMVAELSSALVPGSPREVGAIVVRLLAIYPASNATDAIMSEQINAWIEALEGCPTWAVEAARKRWVQGKVPGVNAEFAPKPPTFRKVVDEQIFPARARRDELAMLLKARAPEPPISQEERERVRQLAEKFAAEVGAVRDLTGVELA